MKRKVYIVKENSDNTNLVFLSKEDVLLHVEASLNELNGDEDIDFNIKASEMTPEEYNNLPEYNG